MLAFYIATHGPQPRRDTTSVRLLLIVSIVLLRG